MPFEPGAGDVHVNRPLTNISIAFVQDEADFVATRAFHEIPVQKQSDRFFTFDRGEFNRDEMAKRAPAAESAGSGYSIDNTPSYYADVWAFHKDIADQIRANYDDPLNADREATIYVSQKSMIRKEKAWASDFFATGVWTTDITGVTSAPSSTQAIQWNDDASVPITDIRTAKRTVKQSTGFDPNVLVVGRETWDQLEDHPEIVDRIKYGQTAPGVAIVTTATVAAVLGLQEILVMNGIENTANEGQTASHSFIGGRSALLLYRPPRPGIMTPAAGYIFTWTGFLGAEVGGQRIKRMRMDLRSADRIEIEAAFDQKLIAADLGYFFTTIVAA